MKNQVDLIHQRTKDAYQWVHKLIEPIAHEDWDQIPENVETNVSWQIGHLLLSYHYHTIMVIDGLQPDLLKKVPKKEYSSFFTMGVPQNAVGKFKPEDLLNSLNEVEAKSLQVISHLNEEDLESELVPTDWPHPIAHDKRGALEWNIQHTMWHCGQLGILRRVLEQRYNFGLKKK